MLIDIYILLTLVIDYLFFICFRKLFITGYSLTPIGGWLIGIFFLVCIPLNIITFNGGYTIKFDVGLWGSVNLNDPSYFGAFFFIWVSLFILCGTFLYLFKNTTSIKLDLFIWINELNINKYRKVIFICCVIMVSLWSISIWASGSILNYFLDYWYLRSETLKEKVGVFYVWLMYLSIANQVIFVSSSGLYLLSKGEKKLSIVIDPIFYLIVLFSAVEMIMSGNRINIAFFGLFIIAGMIQFRLKKWIISIILISPLIIASFSIWPSIRGRVTDIEKGLEIHEARVQTEDSELLVMLVDATSADGIILLFNIIHSFDSDRYLYGSSYIRLLYNFLPKEIVGKTPENFSVILAKVYEDSDETSFSASVIGEGYSNFGVLSIFILPLITVLLQKKSRQLVKKGRITLYECAFLFILSIAFVRFSFSVIIIVGVMCYIIYKIIYRIILSN